MRKSPPTRQGWPPPSPRKQRFSTATEENSRQPEGGGRGGKGKPGMKTGDPPLDECLVGVLHC